MSRYEYENCGNVTENTASKWDIWLLVYGRQQAQSISVTVFMQATEVFTEDCLNGSQVVYDNSKVIKIYFCNNCIRTELLPPNSLLTGNVL